MNDRLERSLNRFRVSRWPGCRLASFLLACLPLLLTAMIASGCEKSYHIPAVTDVTDSTPNPLPDLEKAASDGKRLFLTNCAICHGHEGLGNGPSRSTLIAEPANLTIDPVASYSDGKTFLSIRLGKMVNGRLTMPPVDKMTDEQIWKTIAYLRTLTQK
jgi:mono/diheme cytochrome c family protein